MHNDLFSVAIVGAPDCLWRYTVGPTGKLFEFAPPIFEVDGQVVTAAARLEPASEPTTRHAGVTEHRWVGPLNNDPDLTLEMVLLVARDSPILRFRYILRTRTSRVLTKTSHGADALIYLTTSFQGLPSVKEIRLAEFNEMVHSFCPAEFPVSQGDFDNRLRLIGPLLVGSDTTHAMLLSYEHGSQVPDVFVGYDLAPDGAVTLRAVRGNYCDGQILDEAHPFQTIFLEFGAIAGDEDALAERYREFVLRYLSANTESRRPYIFYNTWAYQERVHAWQKQPYLADMNEERMRAEIDVAARMGIDVFVIDTGWYEKTGDWRVSAARFPNGLAPIKQKLTDNGMKLGLWFNPTVAAMSSEMRRAHEDCLMTKQGKPAEPREVWETEESQWLCLVSRYGDAFADEMIRLNREVGVTYFKWDAIGQYGCDGAGHGHGTEENTFEERRTSYAFELGAAMARVVDKVCAACPDAIVDFDITEGGRTVGLQFLASGKYFLINNGPYNHNYDMPVPTDGNVNLFFYPGAARSWICRTPLTYDRWIPSILFLTHYLPDDTYPVQGWSTAQTVHTDANQWISLASLVLGQNGIWGDLLGITDEGVTRFGETLSRYKQVRDDITAAPLLRTGVPGGSPEIYEKVAANGRGVVSLFACARGRYTYVTRTPVAQGVWHNDGVTVTLDAAGRAYIEANFDGSGAKLVFFGVAS